MRSTVYVDVFYIYIYILLLLLSLFWEGGGRLEQCAV